MEIANRNGWSQGLQNIWYNLLSIQKWTFKCQHKSKRPWNTDYTSNDLCLPRSEKLAAENYLLKLQRIWNKDLRTTANFARLTPAHDSHIAFNLPYVCDYKGCFKCYCVAGVTKTFILKFVQTIRHSTLCVVVMQQRDLLSPKFGAKSSHIFARFQIKRRKNQHIHIACMKLCTLTPKISYYYHLPLHRAITTTVQMAATVPEIMDTSSYSLAFRRRLSCISHFLFCHSLMLCSPLTLFLFV
jgi:hypothetical protein